AYAALNEASRALVVAAGCELQRTSYDFGAQRAGRSYRYAAAASALEQSLARQRLPQRTIGAALGANSAALYCAATNDEVASSVGQLWRAGWRCERDVAQHLVRFLREAREGVDSGPFGEIIGLRSFADFVLVLKEWHAEQVLAPFEQDQQPPSQPIAEGKARRGRPAAAGLRPKQRRPRSGGGGPGAAQEEPDISEVPASLAPLATSEKPIKRSRFFATAFTAAGSEQVSAAGG
ncbi:unnamed protein product, partial [Polarella glacialis]